MPVVPMSSTLFESLRHAWRLSELTLRALLDSVNTAILFDGFVDIERHSGTNKRKESNCVSSEGDTEILFQITLSASNSCRLAVLYDFVKRAAFSIIIASSWFERQLRLIMTCLELSQEAISEPVLCPLLLVEVLVAELEPTLTQRCLRMAELQDMLNLHSQINVDLHYTPNNADLVRITRSLTKIQMQLDDIKNKQECLMRSTELLSKLHRLYLDNLNLDERGRTIKSWKAIHQRLDYVCLRNEAIRTRSEVSKMRAQALLNTVG